MQIWHCQVNVKDYFYWQIYMMGPNDSGIKPDLILCTFTLTDRKRINCGFDHRSDLGKQKRHILD